MQQQALLLTFVIFVQLTFGQFTGGLDGPCSATTIPGPFQVPVNVFGNTAIPNVSNTSNSLCTSSNSPAIWYIIQPDNNNQITVSTCTADTNFDTIVSVYTGNCFQLFCLNYNDDDSQCVHPRTSSVTFTPSAFQTYFISVGGYGTATGIFQLSILENGGTSAGASCSSAVILSSPAEVFDSNDFGTGYSSGCTYSDYKYMWYVLENVQAGIPVNITTCSPETDFDTVLAVFNSCSNTTCAAYNDDSGCFYRNSASSITFTPYSSSPLYIAVGGFGGGVGDYLLSVTQSGITASSACYNAEPAYFYFYEYGYNYDTQPITSDACNHVNNYPTSWFFFTPDGYTSFIASTCNPYTNFATQIFVYSGSCGSLACVSAYPTSYCRAYEDIEVVKPAAGYWASVSATSSVTTTPTSTSSPTRTPFSSPSSTPTPSAYPSNTAQFGNAVSFSLPSNTGYAYIVVTGASPSETGSFYLYLEPN